MAVVPGTVVAVHSMAAPHGPKHNSSGNPVKFCLVDATFSGTYASADKASITTIGASIAAKLRNGKTVTVVDIAGAHPGATSAGALCAAKAASMSSTTALMTLTQADASTEFADGSCSITEPVSFAVQYVES